MRRDQHSFDAPKRAFGAERLGREDIEIGAAEMTALQHIDEISLVDDGAAGAVDEESMAGECLEHCAVDQALGVGGMAPMHRHHVSARQELAEARMRMQLVDIGMSL